MRFYLTRMAERYLDRRFSGSRLSRCVLRENVVVGLDECDAFADRFYRATLI